MWSAEVKSEVACEARQEVLLTEVIAHQNHTMLRVRDIKKSLAFYQDTMGMHHVRTVNNPSAKFTLYFLSYTPLPAGVESEEQIQNETRYREGQQPPTHVVTWRRTSLTHH